MRRLPAPAAVAARPPLPALRAARHRGGLPGGGRGVRPRVGAAGLRGRRRATSSRALKFRGALPVAGLMAAHMAANLPARPPHRAGRSPTGILRTGWRSCPSRRTAAGAGARGFDPAALLAGALAARAGLPARAVPAADATGGGGRSGRGASTRRSAGRFAARSRRAPPPRAAVLVDDVHTTGATLDACARALKAAGAEWVAAITYARTL